MILVVQVAYDDAMETLSILVIKTDDTARFSANMTLGRPEKKESICSYFSKLSFGSTL